ncbi:flagellar hook-basal body complex protein [Cereibacter azotoformans]|uniref:Flagellar basal-body rod protein FlgF n=2 Tax=Cereibacter TaxID=1653176 RepID=A0A2T5KDI1_9RHOB|nr:flagellar hook-basal body complex protein [Cereibacter azotoformans]AXQ93688.1 flagellar hook-basal body complex protein [Cereibacter sphaeroides]MBO4168536.1 flagellar hook-basal body complex protein [Cereibacter azotoformans]PTR20474.1 flagellar basal-body rod protein FlgF [Cereibacter azotoformans]UIJ29189.1 flagellar hook-basal body complex protein [Cereibacter azotoformans]ULB09864.1 flagellar hook-basal body complex protein [Cereibacter azotoformans]
MDRLIHTALNSLANLRDTRVIQAQNLANQTVPGFRRDLTNEGDPRFLKAMETASARAFQTERGPHLFSSAPGLLNQTGEPMDVAIAEEGWFFVQPEGGEPALSRRGDLRLTAEGQLVNGAGEAMLDQAMQPIELPAVRSLVIDEVGRILYEPMDGAPGEEVEGPVIATVIPEGVALRKDADGQIRAGDEPLPAPDQRARILQGVLEGSNVNTMEELVSSIELQRTFELNLRMISAAKELDESGARLLRPPE